MKIIPTIFSQDKKEFNERFAKLIPLAKNIQIDFMDGKFVKSKSVSLTEISGLKKHPNNFEAHLMTYNPEKYIKKLKQKGFKKVIFHYETLKNHRHFLKITNLIKKYRLKVFIALNPETKVEHLFPLLNHADGVLFMGVHPGKERQRFISFVYKKIKILRGINKKIEIQVDGGVNFSIAKKLAKLKVNAINSGSFISESKNPKEVFEKLNKVS